MPIPASLLDTVSNLVGVGPKTQQSLTKLGIQRVVDALFLLPIRYQDRTKITPINLLEAKTEALVDGNILKTNVVFGRRRSLLCTIQDQTGTLNLRFFHFRLTQKSRLKEGTRIRVFGEV